MYRILSIKMLLTTESYKSTRQHEQITRQLKYLTREYQDWVTLWYLEFPRSVGSGSSVVRFFRKAMQNKLGKKGGEIQVKYDELKEVFFIFL